MTTETLELLHTQQAAPKARHIFRVLGPGHTTHSDCVCGAHRRRMLSVFAQARLRVRIRGRGVIYVKYDATQ